MKTIGKNSIIIDNISTIEFTSRQLRAFQLVAQHHSFTRAADFAAFAMLGLRFCPRIRGVQHQRIYRIDPNCDYGSFASLVSRAGQTIDTEQIAEHWDRMDQLYASLKTGHVTASEEPARRRNGQ